MERVLGGAKDVWALVFEPAFLDRSQALISAAFSDVRSFPNILLPARMLLDDHMGT